MKISRFSHYPLKISRVFLVCENRLPFDTTAASGYGLVLLVEILVLAMTLLSTVSFFTVYITVCTYLKSFIDDFALIIAQANVSIQQNVSVKERLKQFIDFSLECNRWFDMRGSFSLVICSACHQLLSLNSVFCFVLSVEYWQFSRISWAHQFSFKLYWAVLNWPLYLFCWKMYVEWQFAS